MKNTNAYKQGLRSGMEDWCITGAPHRTRERPDFKKESDSLAWWLGRCHGFEEARSLIYSKKINEDLFDNT